MSALNHAYVFIYNMCRRNVSVNIFLFPWIIIIFNHPTSKCVPTLKCAWRVCDEFYFYFYFHFATSYSLKRARKYRTTPNILHSLYMQYSAIYYGFISHFIVRNGSVSRRRWRWWWWRWRHGFILVESDGTLPLSNECIHFHSFR